MNREKLKEAKELINDLETSGKVRYIVRGPPCDRKIVKVPVKKSSSRS